MVTKTLTRPPSKTPPSPKTAPFPTTAVVASLRAELIVAVQEDASVRGVPLPATPVEIAKTSISIDSLVVVSILCAVEPILECELSESLVRTGGYRSVESAMEDLLPKIEKQWAKRKGSRL